MGDIKIYAFADEASMQIDEQIVAMKRNGLSGLEMRFVDGANVTEISIDKAKEVKAKLDANGLATWSIGSPLGKINIVDDFAPHLDVFKHTLEIANILDCNNIRLFSFYMPEGENPENYKNEVIDRLGVFVDTAKSSGINLCHENEKGIYGDIAPRCLEIHKALPSLKGVFDPANFVQCGQDTLKAWEMLKDYIYYMHIKDAKWDDGFVVPAGCGDGNVQAIAKAFIEKGGNSFTIEPHLAVFSGLSDLEREGEETKMEFQYPDNNTAFDVACNAFKKIVY